MKFIADFMAGLLQGIDFRDILILGSFGAFIGGLALVYLPAALILPGMAILALGFIRKWF